MNAAGLPQIVISFFRKSAGHVTSIFPILASFLIAMIQLWWYSWKFQLEIPNFKFSGIYRTKVWTLTNKIFIAVDNNLNPDPGKLLVSAPKSKKLFIKIWNISAIKRKTQLTARFYSFYFKKKCASLPSYL